MLIKLTEGTDNEVLYVNHSAVSGLLPAESYMKEKFGASTRVYITGEAQPFYVKETIEEVASSIRDADWELRQITVYQAN